MYRLNIATVSYIAAGPMATPGQATTLPHTFIVGTLHDPGPTSWNIDTGASSHLNNSTTSLSEIFNTCIYPSILVGDSHSIPVTNTGHSILPTPFKSLHLNNVLITPRIVKNMIYVRQFVRDNNCIIEFDAFGFSVKDFMARRHTWHQHLGHLGSDVLRRLVSNNFISCNKEKPHVLCHACQLGKHVSLPFVSSDTVVTSCFDIIRSDVWISPIPSFNDDDVLGVLSLDSRQGTNTTYLLFYVDDIVLTASSETLLQQIISSLHQEFSMIDLGSLNYFLGISVTRDSSKMFLSQRKYAIEILERAAMVCLYMHDPREPYFLTLKLVLRSTSGYCVFLGNNLLSWSFKRQPTLSHSSAEADYRGVANVVAKTCWLRNLLRELHTPLSFATLIYCDNVSAVYLSSNPVRHQRTKHIEIDIHFVRYLVAAG
ncbi:ribonuclease H-like domain-containing protein [Tanacetum coccineum]